LGLTIRDDGKGFDMSSIKQHTSASLSGNGLQNMTMRTKEMNGTIVMKSEPGSGTLVTLRFPIP
jgi:signal transduction histidine kinase